MTMSQTSRADFNINPYKEDRSIYKGQASIASELKPSAQVKRIVKIPQYE